MILVDANLLVYAHVTSFTQHAEAREWLDSRLNGRERVGLPWPSLLAFIRLTTNPRVFSSPLSIDSAWQQVNDWFACDASWTPTPTTNHAEILGKMLSVSGISANLVPDAHLAALAVEHGLTLCSADGDFARFPDLRWRNPLAKAG